MSQSSLTATTHGARDHARSQAARAGRPEIGPTVPASGASGLPEGVGPADVLWDEVVAAGGATSLVVPRGARVRCTDLAGDACAGILLHHAAMPSERLNVADTVKVQWQAYLGLGHLLLSDLGRVLATIVADTSGRHDALCGTTNRAANEARYGDGAPDGPSPNGRDLLALLLAKHGLSRRDVAPNVNLFKGVRVAPDGALGFEGDPRPEAHTELRAELPVLVSVVNVPHPLDPRPAYTVTPLRITAWRGDPAAPDDPWRTATPEGERAFWNTEQVVALGTVASGGR